MESEMGRAFMTFAVLLAAVPGLAEEQPFLEPARHVGPPLPLHAATNRAFQGIPSLAVTPGGRLWATWYASKTPGEDLNNYVVLSTSGDNGKTWNEVLVVDPDEGGPVRAYDPELWMAPDGKLRLAWAQAVGHDGSIAGVWFLTIANPESAEPDHDQPVRVTDGIMMCKPLVLSSGEWALPASTWRATDNSARMVVSTDQGTTWSVRGGCNVPAADRAFDEHMFIERRDGSLWLLARTKYGIGESVSTDRGRTWPGLKPSDIAHPSARFFIRTLKSGNLLLVKHGPIGEQTGRSHLTAFISIDEGKTWGGGLLLDERSGVSYPDGQETDDGLIRIIYDFSRTGARQILMASFREEDAAAGKPVSDAVRLRQIVSEASGGKQQADAVPPPVRENGDGQPLRTTPAGLPDVEGEEPRPFVVGATLFTDRAYVVAECPKALEGAQFLPTPIEGAKQVRCVKGGVLHFLTPLADRNSDSQSSKLLDQGFKKVALSEVRLFNPRSAANFCTLFQKECVEGETIEFGKWAVPLFFATGGDSDAASPE